MVRTKLVYPKILGSGSAPIGRCIAFEKYDGTNLHWVWERELGWYAFGTRRSRFDLDQLGIAEFTAAHEGLEQAPFIFLDSLAESLTNVLTQQNFYQSNEIIAFTEFLGSNSFAGKHRHTDRKQLVLFDIQTQAGFLPPDRFVSDFGALAIARVIYRGKLTGKFIHDVREGRYDVAEGVVCKGESDNQIWMVKIKTNAYMETLKQAFADDWENYWE
ncbi:MAG: RNA ligase family protein [Spirulinaceae cyanobacterium]